MSPFANESSSGMAAWYMYIARAALRQSSACNCSSWTVALTIVKNGTAILSELPVVRHALASDPLLGMAAALLLRMVAELALWPAVVLRRHRSATLLKISIAARRAASTLSWMRPVAL